MTKIGTLAELNVHPGDVVEYVKTGIRTTVTHIVNGRYYGTGDNPEFPYSEDPVFRIISRATPTPKLWRDMTPEEKGALLLAAHEGKVIEWIDIDPELRAFNDDNWRSCAAVGKFDRYAYRVKPEPKVDTVAIGWDGSGPAKGVFCCDTHRITFNLIDGKPDCSSVKMEPLA